MFGVTETVRRLSPSRLATYGNCPRQYEYDKVWDVDSPEESRRYLDRGLVYHAAIEETCEMVRAATAEQSDDDIRQFALQTVDAEWDDRANRSEYHSDAQYEYDRTLTVRAIESFLASDGIDHIRNSVATEADVTCDRGERGFGGRVDNIVRTDDGLHIYDYKGSFNGIVSGYSAKSIPGHRAGEEFIADIMKSLFQSAIYIEGVKQLNIYEPEMNVQFSFYALLKDKTREGHPDGLQVSVSGRTREVTWIYEEYRAEIWALIEECYDGIVAERFEPTRFDDIRENVCDDCSYQAMCGDYLNAEVQIDD